MSNKQWEAKIWGKINVLTFADDVAVLAEKKEVIIKLGEVFIEEAW